MDYSMEFNKEARTVDDVGIKNQKEVENVDSKKDVKEIKKEQKSSMQKGSIQGTKQGGVGLVWVIIISILTSLLSVFLYHHFFATKIAIVDLSGYVIGLRNLYLRGKIDDNTLKSRLDEAVSIIKSYENKYVILPAENVYGKNKNVYVISLPQLPPEANVSVEELMKNLLKERNQAGQSGDMSNMLGTRSEKP